ncbi:MAG: hypothetical protein JG769_227 [Oscillospiraceae bacterium]|jgi:hypothetical protein|nr:hypothetical protein [Oscillospiraceae bacterium]
MMEESIMPNSKWDVFEKTGKISDYLCYKGIDINHYRENFHTFEGEQNNADNNPGDSAS